MARHRRQLALTNAPQGPADRRPSEVISVADMEAAAVAGKAAVFSQVITFIRHYRGSWWISTEAGWLPVRPPTALLLDQQAERMRQPAHKSAANAAAIRAVIELTREVTDAIGSRQKNV